jgi:phospholipase/lecithinase/hemolysin
MNDIFTHVRRSLRSCFALVFLVASLSGTALAQAAEFERVVAFGDSLMDSGNAFILTGNSATPPFAPVPSAPYAIGGHHFSNGRTWVEELGKNLHLQASTGPSARNQSVFSNYAIGGSRARDGAAGPSASQQVMQYLAYTGGSASADTLYAFGFGGNDVRDALEGDPALAGQVIFAAATAINDNLLALCQSGARHIMLSNVANVGITPALQAVGEPAVSYAAYFSDLLNDIVEQGIAGVVQPSCPDTRFYVLDLFGLSTAIFAYPAGFGFVDAQPCLAFGTTSNAICSNPNSKFFWDAIHPTGAGHALVAEEAEKLLDTP